MASKNGTTKRIKIVQNRETENVYQNADMKTLENNRNSKSLFFRDLGLAT